MIPFIIFTSICVAIDASCVNIANGASNKLSFKNIILTTLCFGIMQVIMLLAGYYLSFLFSHTILQVSQYLAFGLLCYLSISMLISSFKKEEVKTLNYKNILLQGLATSFDAAALGITLYALKYDILINSISVFSITIIFCFIAYIIGNRIGAKYNNHAKIIAAVILFLIALKILIIK